MKSRTFDLFIHSALLGLLTASYAYSLHDFARIGF